MAAYHSHFEGSHQRRSRGRRGRGGERFWGPTGQMQESKAISEDQIEPLKVYVGNLRMSVTDLELRDVFSHYATVVHAFIVKDKHTRRSRGFGFVQVATPEDVQKLLSLKDGDKYICGQRVSIQPAIKKAVLPGDYDYVRHELSDRLFDLEAEDQSLPCIHILVDDVLFKIFELLPLKTLIGVERVCRRWQMLIHKLFARRTSLNLCRESLGLCGPLTRTIVSKLLILSGPTLRELKVQNIDYSTRHNILRMIAQLCPELESLDVTQALGINFSNLKFLTKGCRKLKTFIAEKCPDFDDRSLREVLGSYPELQHLNISGFYSTGINLTMLPSTLKVLKLSICHSITPENLKLIGDRCPSLEVLNISQIVAPQAALEYIGTNCPEMKEMKLSLTSRGAAEALRSFKRLKKLDLEVEFSCELFPVIEHLAELEALTIRSGHETVARETKLNFGAFKYLKEVTLSRVGISAESMKSLSKCTCLKSLHLLGGMNMETDMFLNILRGCPELQIFSSLSTTLTLEVIKVVNDIMKGRTGPITLAMYLDWDVEPEQYDSKKIKLDRLTHLLQLSEDSDYDDLDDYDNDSLFSGNSLDEYWMYGYGSDNSLHDDFVYQDHFEFLERHLGLFELGLDEDIYPYVFD
ncbi:uncharacterized protein [Palaemon carinicauda]|uniref:uncharacterized protein n=1 Tax=Palaemon carinicauda TaxID=392227 RepID=UPI0035B655D9